MKSGNQKQRSPRTKWLMLSFVALFSFWVNGFIYTTFNLVLVNLAKDAGWTIVERGLVATGLSTGMIWFVFVAGIAVDRVNLKRMFGSLLIIASLLVVARGFLTNAALYFALMFLFGAINAFLIPAETKILSLWFGAKDFALANGIFTAANPLGHLVGNVLTYPIMQALGDNWRWLFVIQGAGLAAIGIAFLLFASERKNSDAELGSQQMVPNAEQGVRSDIKAISKVPQFWLYVLANACFVGLVYGGGSQNYVLLQVDPRWALPPQTIGLALSAGSISSTIMFVVAPLIINKLFAKNYEENYRKIAIICGLFAGVVCFIGIRSYSLVGITVSMVLSGIAFGQIVPTPKVLMLKLPEVSGARAGTALGIFHTAERIVQTLIVSLYSTVLVMFPENPARYLSYVYILYCLSPVLILIAWKLETRSVKKSYPCRVGENATRTT